MFELNDNLEIKKELFQGTVIYTIDDFYKYPQEVDDYLFSEPNKIPLHKIWENPTFNGVHFEDRRHEGYSIDNLDIAKVYDFLSKLCGQGYQGAEVVTNCTRFKRHEFNDYENCHWWPHRDGGYNGIVYFNDDDKLIDPVWESVSLKIKKYIPFLNINMVQYKTHLIEKVQREN